MGHFLHRVKYFKFSDQTTLVTWKGSCYNSVQKVWTPSSVNKPPYMAKVLLYIFFYQTPHFWQHFFDNITLMTCRTNTKMNSWGKVSSSCLEDYKTTLSMLFYVQHFCKQHQHFAALSLQNLWTTNKKSAYFTIDNPLHKLTLFLKEILEPPICWFS